MPFADSTRTTARQVLIRWIGAAALLAALAAAAFGDPSQGRWPPEEETLVAAQRRGPADPVEGSAGSTSAAPSSAATSAPSPSAPSGASGSALSAERPPLLPGAAGDGLGAADGALPDDASVFDDVAPGLAKLDPALLGAVRRAATDAAGDGMRFVVNSGWRSPEYQDHLRRAAIEQYGSQEEAARWVASATTSPHVAGEAVDLGPTEAADWLHRHGPAYGLCRIYANEPWHFELRAGAAEDGCPAAYADPTHDPRLQP